MSPEPRRARPEDAAAVAALTRRAYAKHVPRIGREPQPMTADYAQMIAAHEVWLIDGPGGATATLVLMIEPDHVLIWSIAVDPAAQGSGLARRLMALAESEACRRGLSELRLFTNEKFTENIAFYTRRGYRETERRPYKGGHLVFMRKSIQCP